MRLRRPLVVVALLAAMAAGVAAQLRSIKAEFDPVVEAAGVHASTTVKAALVVLFFMHVYESSPLTKVVIFCSLFILTVLLTFFMVDYTTRNLNVLPPDEVPVTVPKKAA